ncbi:hypothetical protein Trisim1_003336 [Trichoderma cf. simile WF8]|uniref:Uncharacterized protein n=1 Tax=Trichoderma guizhouense TaxID=1491466 RepID=A0A1T3D1E1_9HYPO|nr:hypothetical protein A0O28_0071790 [Trichoderma guizhouense]
MRVVMLFILLCIKLGFPKFFKFYEFLKNRFQPFRRTPKRKSKKTKTVRFAEPKKNVRVVYQAFSRYF